MEVISLQQEKTREGMSQKKFEGFPPVFFPGIFLFSYFPKKEIVTFSALDLFDTQVPLFHA